MPKKKLIIFGVIVILIIFLPGYAKFQQLRMKNNSLVREIEGLKKENTDLAQQIKKLEKDSFYMEKAARDKMGMAKEGELKYKVIYENKKSK